MSQRYSRRTGSLNLLLIFIHFKKILSEILSKMSFVELREGETEAQDRILMGTIDGKVALLMLDKDKNLRISWVLNKSGSEVTSLDSFEIQDGIDLIVGRHDGSVEVHTLPPDEDMDPILRFRYVSCRPVYMIFF